MLHVSSTGTEVADPTYTVGTTLAGTRGRTGTITTPHGQIHTPAFIPVGTKATVKTLKRSGGKQWLLPQNPIYDPIDGDHATIMGIVTAVIRRV